jgi:hypothetical protein
MMQKRRKIERKKKKGGRKVNVTRGRRDVRREKAVRRGDKEPHPM